MQGDSENLVHFEWDPEYQDFTNRFEQWIDLRELKITSSTDLYDALHDWLGITKKGIMLPSQKQMDFFSEYFGSSYFDISAQERIEKEIEAEAPTYGYTCGHFYNTGTHVFRYYDARSDKTIIYTAEEKVYNFKYGRRIVLRDAKSKKILAHHIDLTTEKYLGSQV
jgi:hypothetical protein